MSAMVPDVGALAPEFTLADSSGTRHDLASLVADRSLVLIFLRGHW